MHKVTVKDFPYLSFGDIRRNERFVTIINNISSQPGSSIPKQNGSWYDTKANYGFFRNKDVSIEELKQVIMHYGASQLGEESTILIAHDISNISYNDLQASGLGYLDNKEGRGLLCYSSIAATAQGLPLSLLYQHTWTRPLEALGKSAGRKRLPFEEKETYRWKEGMDQVNGLLGDGLHKVHIADREADVYDLFFHAYQENTDLLIRARHQRNLSGGEHLWGHVSALPPAGTSLLEIPDKTGKNKVAVEVEVRFGKVEILRPKNNRKDCESVALTAIEVKEKTCGDVDREMAVHWKLLTTLEVGSAEDALRCVKWYTFRWLIERFHYVLKSGVKIEKLQLKEAESLQKAVAVYSIAAFRVMQLVYHSRHRADIDCEVALTKAQWATLFILANRSTEIPDSPPSLKQAVMWIGRLGGHLGRKSDGPPGLKTVWLGYQQLCHAASVYEIMSQNLGKA